MSTPARPSSSRAPSRGRRPSGGGRPRSGGGSRPAPQPVKSDLEIGLDAAADLSVIAADQPVPSFQELGLPEKLISALARRSVLAPFAIQARALPDAIAGRDVLGRGQTGSGKTLAFGLPMLARLAGGPRTPRAPRGLVLVPTRELAQQVNDALAPLGQALDLKVMTIYGGAPMGRQIDQLRRGADIVVATPGRLQDLIQQGECDLSGIRITVLDEADHMADLGFLPAVRALLDLTPPTSQRMLFSATLDRGVDTLVRAYLTDPALHAVAAAASPVDTMDHVVFSVQRDAKVDIAAEIASRPARTLLFVRTKHGADRLATQLSKTGVNAVSLHGNLTQNARKRALDAFTRGSSRVLVATDVAARGIHVDDVDLVVHYDPPTDHKDYLHRSGRTARAGARGTVVSLLLSDEVRAHQRLREQAGIDANAVAVVPGHPAVRELAESGDAIVVVHAPVSATSDRPARTARPPRTYADRGPWERNDSRGGSQGRSDSRTDRPRRDDRPASSTSGGSTSGNGRVWTSDPSSATGTTSADRPVRPASRPTGAPTRRPSTGGPARRPQGPSRGV